MLVSCVCLSRCFFACPRLHLIRFNSNLHRTWHTGRHQSGKELIRFPRSSVKGQGHAATNMETFEPDRSGTADGIRTKTLTNKYFDWETKDYVFKVIGSKVTVDRSCFIVYWNSTVVMETSFSQLNNFHPSRLVLPCDCMRCNARYSHAWAKCPYVRLSNAWIVTKRKKLLSTFLYILGYMKEHSS